MNPRILFILKYRESSNEYHDYWNEHEKNKSYSNQPLSSGLLNSVRFIVEMLDDLHIEVKLVHVTDNNDIDREVANYKPTHVLIEALWVVPEKFDILQKLHPTVKWIIRGHSEIPFLSMEGVAIKWINGYVQHDNVIFASNSKQAASDIQGLVKSANPSWDASKVAEKVIYLPNYYPWESCTIFHLKNGDRNVLDIGCFGAIRPLKNQLLQAVAAIKFADQKGKKLFFHINSTRVEGNGDSITKNLEALFESNPLHTLVKHEWMPHDQFLQLVKQMDVNMQVSFSETFNIVAADCVKGGVPIVTSPAISWSSPYCQADPTNVDDIVAKLNNVTHWVARPIIKLFNRSNLGYHSRCAEQIWFDYFTK